MTSSPQQIVQIFNTLTREVETFRPIEEGKLRLYTCGPTVYSYAHVGNLRTYLLEDLVRRTFECAGYAVRHVMNITDVGHLESDADAGEDKLELAARREQQLPWDIARSYEAAFFADCTKLNLEPPAVVCRATEHIDDMIQLIQCIESKGFAYVEDGNVYFSIEKFPEYGKLAQLDLDNIRAGARIEVDSRKRNPLDFVLWFSKSKFPRQIMQWASPWGQGFPGWHIECSAMASKYLADRIDVHMGGIDHIPVHHTNEIAQSEACLGHRWVNYWMHCNFLVMHDAKMSKSRGAYLTLAAIAEKGFEPMHYRYFCLTAHYRSSQVLTWEALEGARKAFDSLRNRVIAWKIESRAKQHSSVGDDDGANGYSSRFWGYIYDDINVPAALGVAWIMAKDSLLSSVKKVELMLDFDRVLGIDVAGFERPAIDPMDQELIQRREAARKARDWDLADAIRNRLFTERKIQLMDTPDRTEWYFLPKDE